jgi:branched-chain amino acid transport system ATP-binding protein
MSDDFILQVSGIQVRYDNVILGLQEVSIHVRKGQITALLGANGAGKSTTLKAISGLLASDRGTIVKGHIHFDGEDTEGLEPHDRVRRGLVQVMEGRHCFAHLTIEENLRMGAFARRAPAPAIRDDIERIYEYFPRLRLRRKLAAGYTSGGEQQMLALGRALMSKPKLILLDEPSMGLAPQTVEDIFEIVRELNAKEGLSFLIAEQNAAVSLRVAHDGYLMENGSIAASGPASTLLNSNAIRSAYLGRIRKKEEGQAR